MIHRRRGIIMVLGWVLISILSYGQDTNANVEFSNNFIFKEGLYLTINSWKQNNPIALDSIVTDLDKKDKRFFIKLLSNRFVTYIDNGIPHKIKTKKLFGYCSENFIFTKEHYKMGIIGSICHYTIDSNKTVESKLMRHMIFGIFARHNTERLKSYIIDFEENTKYIFNIKSIESILKRDKALFATYKKDKGKIKAKLYKYLSIYNERNPIHFPS